MTQSPAFDTACTDAAAWPILRRVDPLPRLGTADLLTVGEVATDLRVSTSTVHRLIRTGSLRAYAMGATYRIARPDLVRYLGGARTSADARTDADGHALTSTDAMTEQETT
ncbi:MAG: excisionase family DNA binding protein [Nonlabens sp.]